MNRGRVSLLLLLCAFSARAAAPLPPPADRKIDFVKDVQPILSSRCYECHGEKKQKGELRWDVKSAALKGGSSGPALGAGKSAESLMVQMIAGLKGLDSRMPAKGEPLTAEQIGILRAWIDQGAVWPDGVDTASVADPKNHWGFKTPVRPAVPAASNEEWVKTPVDPFILARLDAEKLKPSQEASKATLIRRLSLDLTGLPPSIEDVDAFMADKSGDAYDKVVEKLLASPHYGERWGRHWLDAARYADSDGYEKDMSREIWPYRDYVVGAFNRDLPYNQFILEQIAGDELPNATQDQVVATGFLRNSMCNMEGAIDPEQFRMEGLFDRMDALGKAVLGLTVQCAQCHTHKFDPITHEEYYKLFAYLNNDHEARPAVYMLDQQKKLRELTNEIASIESSLKERTPDWEKRMAAWESSVSGNQPEWIVVTNLNQEGDKSQRYLDEDDGSLLAAGYAPTKFTQYFRVTNNLSGVTAFRLELLTDPNLPFGGPGRSFNGTCALSEFVVEAMDAKAPTNKAKVKWASASSDYDQPDRALEKNFDDRATTNRITGPVKYAIDGKGETAWGINAGAGRRNQDRKAVFVAEKPAGFTNGTYWRIGLGQNHGGWNSDDHMNNNLGRFRVSVTTGTNGLKADPLPKRIREALAMAAEKRSSNDKAAMFSYWRTTVAEFKAENDRIGGLYKSWPEPASSLTLLARSNSRSTHLLRRGDWLKPAQVVKAGTPAFLHPLPKNADDSRLTLAKWLVDPKSPTTARVFVNRVWQAYFGIGLVATPEDFGMQSQKPSHPELLDWLACEFMEKGWSIKSLHRLIVKSSTYRQSSNMSQEQYDRDPYNRLLARGPRFRMEGEIVRDIALSASGLLNPKLGGPSVTPPAPSFLFLPPASYAPFPWKDAEGAEKYRRGLYTFRRRTTPYPALQTFDVPNADAACVKRQRSNSPLQALVALNEPIFMECAQALARKTLAEGGKSDEQRITYAFRRTLARSPQPDEVQELTALLEKQRKRIADGWINPSEVATGSGEVAKDLPKGATPAQFAAFTVVSRALLNLDETISKE